MYTTLGEAELKNGELLELGRVDTPDLDWLPEIKGFLAHKGPDWLPQIQGSLSGPLDGLSTQFYVGRIAGRLACQVMLAGDRRVGLVGHVYTDPNHRRKGAIGALLPVLLNDSVASYDILTLGTEFDSTAYWIYHRLGFRSVGPGRGEMILTQSAWADAQTVGQMSVRDVKWDDWALFNWLALRPVAPGEDLPRSPALGLTGQGSVEAAFLQLQQSRSADPRIQAVALESVANITAGWALLTPDPSWPDGKLRLDVYAPPSPLDFGPLLSAMRLPDAPVLSYLSNPAGAKADALRSIGFEASGVLPRWVRTDLGFHDITIMARS